LLKNSIMSSNISEEHIQVPEGFTNPSPSFKKHLIFAIIGLVAFIFIYLGLMAWFGYLSYSLIISLFNGNTNNGFVQFFTAIGLAFLSLFMFKSLFIFNKQSGSFGKEVTPKSEPKLFEFLHSLADEIGAPRPHRVFITSRVNASVFYDLSIINLIFPTKKNLEIGLGLVNVLNMGEFKAVLAHEFGHFAQKSMLLGRYVYVAQQIASKVVNKRDALDSFLSGLSSVDIRIAWIGWILSILVWAIRSLIETLFSIVAIAEKALSREMEFHADLVAVSVTGSDALIHALYKLRAADQGYQSSIDAINTELEEKKAVNDMFAIQTNYIEKMQWVLDDPTFGASPQIVGNDGKNRIFSHGLVNPPQMWATHPLDNDREENAKKTYIPADIDKASVWNLFTSPNELRLTETATFIATAGIETELLSNTESIERYDKNIFSWKFLNPDYAGAYINRYPFIHYENVEEAYDIEVNEKNLTSIFKDLYTKDFKEKIKKLDELKDECQMLEVVQHEVVTAEKRKIMHRGEEIKRNDIPEILQSLKVELSKARSEVIEKDRLCRKIHWVVANKKDAKYAEYLKSISGLVHYAEHTITDLDDAYKKYNNVLSVVLADGNVSSSELKDVLVVSNDLYFLLNDVFNKSKTIKLNTALKQRLDGKEYAELFEPFKLGPAVEDNINNWVNVIGGWLGVALEGLHKLRVASLEHLLDCEEVIRQSFENNTAIDFTPESITNAQEYNTLLPGKERKLQYKLGLWDRFYAADGLFPTIAKFGVSAALVIGALTLGFMVQSTSTLSMYNGLEIGVNVSIGDDKYFIEPHNYEKIELIDNNDLKILTTAPNGDIIEHFRPILKSTAQQYVYNVASASLLFEEPIAYGNVIPREPKSLGSPRWATSDADYVFNQPPENITLSSRSKGEIRYFINAYSKENPYQLIGFVDKFDDPKDLILSHAKWDHQNSPNTLYWLALAAGVDNDLTFIDHRLKRNPHEVSSIRVLMDYSTGSPRDEVCQRYSKLSQEDTSNPDFYYIATRCMEDGIKQNQAFIKGHEKWPDHVWLGMASGLNYASQQMWEEAYNSLGNACSQNESILNAYAIELERIKRVAETSGIDISAFENLLSNHLQVSYYRALDNLTKEDKNEGMYANIEVAYSLISKGRIKDNLTINEDEENKYIIERFIAASSNAPMEIVEKVSGFSVDHGINESTIWMAIGTAVKYKQQKENYLKKLSEMYQGDRNFSQEVTVKFLDLLKRKNIKAAERLILPFDDFTLKARYYLLGSIILGEDAPQNWKNYVNTFLFANERPFISND